VFLNHRDRTHGKNSNADGKSGADENYFYEYAIFSNFIFYFGSADRILCSKLVLTTVRKVEKHWVKQFRERSNII